MYLTWTTSSFGLHPEGWQPSQPHLVATDNADYLSERCEMVPKNRVRQDETEQNVLSDHVGMGKDLVEPSTLAGVSQTGKKTRWRSQSEALVEPIGFEPMTSCLQSRRSTN